MPCCRLYHGYFGLSDGKSQSWSARLRTSLGDLFRLVPRQEQYEAFSCSTLCWAWQGIIRTIVTEDGDVPIFKRHASASILTLWKLVTINANLRKATPERPSLCLCIVHQSWSLSIRVFILQSSSSLKREHTFVINLKKWRMLFLIYLIATRFFTF